MSVLISLQGIEGKYIRTQPLVDSYAPRHFQVDQTLGKVGFIVMKHLLIFALN